MALKWNIGSGAGVRTTGAGTAGGAINQFLRGPLASIQPRRGGGLALTQASRPPIPPGSTHPTQASLAAQAGRVPALRSARLLSTYGVR